MNTPLLFGEERRGRGEGVSVRVLVKRESEEGKEEEEGKGGGMWLLSLVTYLVEEVMREFRVDDYMVVIPCVHCLEEKEKEEEGEEEEGKGGGVRFCLDGACSFCSSGGILVLIFLLLPSLLAFLLLLNPPLPSPSKKKPSRVSRFLPLTMLSNPSPMVKII